MNLQALKALTILLCPVSFLIILKNFNKKPPPLTYTRAWWLNGVQRMQEIALKILYIIFKCGKDNERQLLIFTVLYGGCSKIRLLKREE
ncbi:hypothetical protein AHMF7605_00150 [Adhaeribacter arboris]|uniref:Uncharacterized protein n=1 Tax=Adhaeribacter arboris TaxID=2072846 RepID=A0A2T2Y944_9BACT|nr:hypothetical protein AHMF7605_00150 [Adhaeribacter arboris]